MVARARRLRYKHLMPMAGRPAPPALLDDIGHFFTYLASIAMARLALVIMGHDIKEVHQ